MRTAIYFTPEQYHPLSRAGARWLGRDPWGEDLPGGPALGGLDAGEWAALTASPRRYGFHATIKAPFALARGKSVAALDSALAAFCQETPPFTLPPLKLGRLGSFFALVPEEDCSALDTLAGEVVKAFEPFRAPLRESDLARRRETSLTAVQDENLVRWGYPYVFGDFRFHMTLTGPVDEDRSAFVEQALADQFAPFLGQELAFDGLALFFEPKAGDDFTAFFRHALRMP